MTDAIFFAALWGFLTLASIPLFLFISGAIVMAIFGKNNLGRNGKIEKGEIEPPKVFIVLGGLLLGIVAAVFSLRFCIESISTIVALAG